MGLESYAYRVEDADYLPDFDADVFSVKTGVDPEFFYWYEHYDLDEWMHKKYQTKGGTDEYFNQVFLRLTLNDLDHLEADMKRGLKPARAPFFVGKSRPEHHDMTVDFIAKARCALADGAGVFYMAWY